MLGERGGRAVDDVVPCVWQVARIDVRRDVRRHGQVVRGGCREVVVQADGLVDGHQRVEAVGPWRTDAEEEVDLRWGADGQAPAGAAHARASAIRANSSTVSD